MLGWYAPKTEKMNSTLHCEREKCHNDPSKVWSRKERAQAGARSYGVKV